jgi:hypothetical protein
METPVGVVIFVIWRSGWHFLALRTSASTLYSVTSPAMQKHQFND